MSGCQSRYLTRTNRISTGKSRGATPRADNYSALQNGAAWQPHARSVRLRRRSVQLPRRLSKELVEASGHADAFGDGAYGKERAGNVRRGSGAGIVADRKPPVPPPQHDLRGDAEARQ